MGFPGMYSKIQQDYFFHISISVKEPILDFPGITAKISTGLFVFDISLRKTYFALYMKEMICLSELTQIATLAGNVPF